VPRGRIASHDVGGDNLDRALATVEAVEVVCFPQGHNWTLNAQDIANLRKLRGELEMR
jgi:hypothetical protein